MRRQTKQNRGGNTKHYNKYKNYKNATKKNKNSNTTTRKNKNKRNITLQHINCSPKEKNIVNEFSCYTDASLYKLRDKWNARHSDLKINTNNPKEIHSRLTSYLSNVCNKESCWLKQTKDLGNVDNDLYNSFAPKRPKEWDKNPNEWLSSVDIIKVMKQYERAYKCFDFIGPTPIDFNTRQLYGQCVWDELCNFNLKKQIESGKNKIGIIFNTDPHYKPGQHWISMFINIKHSKIIFFDSAGDPPPKEIMDLVNTIKKQGLLLKDKIHFKYYDTTGIEHQLGNTECGVYSLYFIVHMIQDKLSNDYLKTHRIKDEYVNKFRNVYFNKNL